MGNTISTTNLDISPIFDHEPVLDPNPISVRIHAQGIEDFILRIQGNTTTALDIANLQLPEFKDAHVYDWSPHSHMRDFEVLDPFTSQEIRIARGQGIGIILAEPLGIYLKVIYDQKDPMGINIVQNTSYLNKKEEVELAVRADLNIGYDLLFITKDEEQHFCEVPDERDETDTKIFAPGCEGLDKYEK